MSDDTHLFSLQRREKVMDELRARGSVRVSELARDFDVSEITVRRDLLALAGQGLVTRVHGGATLTSPLEANVLPGARASTSSPARFTIGMVVPSLSFYWPHVINGARAAAAAGRERIVLRGSSYDSRDDRTNILKLLATPGIHGLLLAPNTTDAGGPDLIRWLDTLKVPVVLVERRPPVGVHTQNLQWVATDHAYGAGLAVRHLHAQGHRRIGLLLPAGSPHADQIKRGWRLTCQELGVPSGDELTGISAGFQDPGWAQVVSARMADIERTGTTAVIVHSDPEAIALLQLCADRGIRVPHDLAVVAYDDEVAAMAEPALTAVRPPKSHIGRVAVELLTARMYEGRKRPLHHVVVDPELIVRDSSRVPRDAGARTRSLGT